MAWLAVGNLKGPKGDKGDPGLVGPAGTQYRGVWAAGTAYVEHDVVTRNGASWIVPTGTANMPAGNDPNVSGDGNTATNGWQLFAAEGAKGDKGDPGNPGAPGARGSQWFTGHGAPGVIAGSAVNDQYLDLDSGDVYTLA
jgi:hypothetical protein